MLNIIANDHWIRVPQRPEFRSRVLFHIKKACFKRLLLSQGDAME